MDASRSGRNSARSPGRTLTVVCLSEAWARHRAVARVSRTRPGVWRSHLTFISIGNRLVGRTSRQNWCFYGDSSLAFDGWRRSEERPSCSARALLCRPCYLHPALYVGKLLSQSGAACGARTIASRRLFPLLPPSLSRCSPKGNRVRGVPRSGAVSWTASDAALPPSHSLVRRFFNAGERERRVPKLSHSRVFVCSNCICLFHLLLLRSGRGPCLITTQLIDGYALSFAYR